MFRFISLTALCAAISFAASTVNLRGMAAGILQQSKLAREAVAHHDSAAALDHIHQGSVLADEIFRTAPPEPRPILVQVDRDTDTTTTYSPVKGRHNGEFDPQRLKKNSTVRDVDATVTVGKLDVNRAAAHLDSAQDAVMRDDWMAADSELAAIPNGVIRSTVQGNMPLLEARQNLRLARMRVMEDKYKDAKAPLEAAALNLRDFEELSPGPHAQDAEYLRQKIEAYARIVSHRPADALNQIDAWLDPIDHWYQESTD